MLYFVIFVELIFVDLECDSMVTHHICTVSKGRNFVDRWVSMKISLENSLPYGNIGGLKGFFERIISKF